MLGRLSDTDRAIFTTIWKRRRAGGASLAAIAAEVGLKPPSCLARLRHLRDLALIDRVGQRRPVYFPRPYFEARVVDPVEGLVDSWQMNELPDWRFPLVGRVPDAPARLSLNRLLGRLWDLGLIGAKARVAIAVVAYGSCVDGTARKGSDLDLLVLTTPTVNNRAIQEAVAEVNLSVDRKIDARVLSLESFEKLPEALKTEVRNGKTVFRSSAAIGIVEALS